MKKLSVLVLLVLGVVGNAVAGFNFYSLPQTVPTILTSTSGSMGGSLLLVGACISSTTSVPGATTGMVADITPTTNPGTGALWYGYVSAPDVVTVKVCALVALTPVASTYNIRVF